MYKLCVSTPFFRHETKLGKLCFNLVGICLRFIDFIHRNNNRNLGIFCVIYSFYCLRHNAVIGCYNKNNNVSNLCTTCPHHSKGFVSRCIEEGYSTLLGFNHVSTNMLGDTTKFSGNNVCRTNSIKSFCFTVVNVSHDCYNRWTRSHIFWLIFLTCNNGFIV